jgi:hypothetical protein
MVHFDVVKEQTSLITQPVFKCSIFDTWFYLDPAVGLANINSRLTPYQQYSYGIDTA